VATPGGEQENNALQSQIYQSNKGMIQPYVDRGNAAGDELNGFLSLGGDPAKTKAAFDAYLNSTGYQFNYDQGINAVNSDRAASGLLNSGSTLKALDEFGTGLPDSYGQQYADNLFKVDQLGGPERLGHGGRRAELRQRQQSEQQQCRERVCQRRLG
jgi:hypothetical protein